MIVYDIRRHKLFFRKTVARFLGVGGLFFVFLLFGFVLRAEAALINATGLIGQTDTNGNPVYTTSSTNNGSGTLNAQGLDYTTSSVLDPVDHRLFVADKNNRRILSFPLDSNNKISSTTATFVLGASNFTTIGSGVVSQNTFGSSNVLNLAYDSVNKRLFVSDCGWHRVTVFSVPGNATSSINGENAAFVLGQTDFTSSSHDVTQSKFYCPDNLFFDSTNNRLFVSDMWNSRILVFSIAPNADSSINGKNADYVLGQPDFTTNTTRTTKNGLTYPTGLAFDAINNRLFVSDMYNHRIMIFDIPLGTDLTYKNADYVLGQGNFTDGAASIAINRLNYPDDLLGYDPTNYRLFVSDTGNNRIMIFNVPTGANLTGENAQNVLGQDDYVSTTVGITQNRFSSPNGQDSFDPTNNRLFVKDRPSNRIMEFSMIKITTSSFPNGAIGVPYSLAIATTSGQATPTVFSIYSGALPDGLSLATATGVVSGTPTAATTSASFTIEADNNYSTGPFFDRASYSMNVIGISRLTTSAASFVATSTATLNGSITATGGENATQSGFAYGTNATLATTIATSSLGAQVGLASFTQALTNLTPNTTYYFRAYAVNSAGTSTGSILSFSTTDITPPTVSMTAPTTDSTVSGSSVTLSATASDDVAVVGVQFKLDANTLIADDTVSPFSITWGSTGAADGDHTLIAVARDAVGNYATSTAITVTVDNTAPVLSAGLPFGTQVVNITSVSLLLSTNEDALCKYGTIANIAYASIANSFSATSTTHSAIISNLLNGQNYNYYIRCQDNVGNTSSSDYTIYFSVADEVKAGGGGMPLGWSIMPIIPTGGFKVSVNSGVSTVMDRIVNLSFNAGSDVKKMAISLTDDFNDASQESYSTTKQIDLCSKSGGLIKNKTCPDGQYAVYIKFYTQYGMASNVISTKVNLSTNPAKNTSPALPNLTSAIFTKPLSFGIFSNEVRRLQILLATKPEIYPEGLITGYFGQLTKKAVQRFQLNYKVVNLRISSGFGVVGPKTRAKLQEVFGNNN